MCSFVVLLNMKFASTDKYVSVALIRINVICQRDVMIRDFGGFSLTFSLPTARRYKERLSFW